MRNPVDVSSFNKCPLTQLPFLHPRLEEALCNGGIESLFPVQVAVWQETMGPRLLRKRYLCEFTDREAGKP
ncbi:putative RNA helicase [Helianthus annuus]|nr:putative RNA helicase [Helianthus annuus]